jgi:hypothetical protein
MYGYTPKGNVASCKLKQLLDTELSCHFPHHDAPQALHNGCCSWVLVVHQWVEVPNEQPQQPRTLAGDCHCCGEGVALLAIVLLNVTEQCGLTLHMSNV